jgi:hypothetical protein
VTILKYNSSCVITICGFIGIFFVVIFIGVILYGIITRYTNRTNSYPRYTPIPIYPISQQQYPIYQPPY